MILYRDTFEYRKRNTMKKKIRLFFSTRAGLLNIIISLALTFVYVNFGFSLLELGNNSSPNLGIILGVTVIAVAVLVLLLIALTNEDVRLRVIVNNYNKIFLKIIALALAVILIGDIVLMVGGKYLPITIFDSKKGLGGIVSVIISLCASWYAFIKKVQVLKVKIVTSNNIYENEVLTVGLDERFKVCALCDGSNEDWVKFIGFCLPNDVDRIVDNSRDNNTEKIMLPKYFRQKTEDLIEPHKLSEPYSFYGRNIVNSLKEHGYKGSDLHNPVICLLYRDSKGNYFYEDLKIKTCEE